jgi:hypothetical protein
MGIFARCQQNGATMTLTFPRVEHAGLIDQYQAIAREQGLTEWLRTDVTRVSTDWLRGATSKELQAFAKAHGLDTGGSTVPADLVAFILRARQHESKRLSAISKRIKADGVVAAAKATYNGRAIKVAPPATLSADDVAALAAMRPSKVP